MGDEGARPDKERYGLSEWGRIDTARLRGCRVEQSECFWYAQRRTIVSRAVVFEAARLGLAGLGVGSCSRDAAGWLR